MKKKGIVYIIIGILALSAVLLLEYNKSKEINWSPSYVSHHKIPYGTFVLHQLLEKKFSTKDILIPPFEFFKKDTIPNGTYFFVNNSVTFEEAELHHLLDWVARGNTLFLASERIEDKLLDTLGLEVNRLFNSTQLQPTFQFQLENKELNPKKHASYTKDYYANYFDKIDTLNTTSLGWVKEKSESSSQKNINTIMQPFGQGKIILSLFPKAFTNYFILQKSNKDYTGGLLSYINKNATIYIDNYHKVGKSFYTSPMYLFLNKTPLKWAYYITLIGVFLYIIFEGKRKQRAIPVVNPLQNQTIAFTKTIANMYFEKGEFKPIISQKIAHFMEYIRMHYYITTNHINQEFYVNLASRTHHSPEDIKQLFNYLNTIEKQEVVTDKDLIDLNKKIESFKAIANGK